MDDVRADETGGVAVLDVLFMVQTEIQQHMGLCCHTQIKILW